MTKEQLLRVACISVLIYIVFVSVLLLSFGEGDSIETLLAKSVIQANQPIEAFGIFHFVAIGICVIITIFFGILAWRKPNDNTIDRVVFLFGVAFFLLEWYKQLLYNFVIGNGDYDFTVFPFQFCSLPIYICLFAPLCKKKIRLVFYRFLALFGTVGGYLVIAYPNMPESLTMCVYTMIWHTLMTALGIYLLIATDCGRHFATDYFPAVAVFLLSLLCATGLNCAFENISKGTINLFYMSPYHPNSNYFIIRDVQKLYGWGASISAYSLFFMLLGAFPLWCIGAIFCRIRRNRVKK